MNILNSLYQYAGCCIGVWFITSISYALVSQIKEAEQKDNKKWYYPLFCIVVGLIIFMFSNNSK